MTGRSLAAAIGRFERDRRSGSAELAATAAHILHTARIQEYTPAAMDRLRDRLIRAHSAMAAVHNVATAEDPMAWLDEVTRAQRRAIRRCRAALPRNACVLTLSYSSTVLQALARRDLRVTVAESLPGGEGRTVQRRRASHGLRTRVIPDAVIGIAAREVDCAVVGADALTPTRVVNKVGTRLLALACRDAGIPCYVAADPSKRVPRSWPLPEYSDRRPFEAVPRRLFHRIIDGV